MDFTQLAPAAVAALAPALPYLGILGEKALEGAAAKIGEQAWGQAQGLWQRLRDWAGSGPQQAMVAELAADPERKVARDALALYLAEALERDPDLAGAIQGLLQGGTVKVAHAGDNSVIVQGNGNKVANGASVVADNIQGSVINTGGGVR